MGHEAIKMPSLPYLPIITLAPMRHDARCAYAHKPPASPPAASAAPLRHTPLAVSRALSCSGLW